MSFNPALDRSFHGPGVNQGVAFSPNVKVSYDFTKKIAGGLEYYAAYGPLTGFDALRDQQQQFFPTIDVDFGRSGSSTSEWASARPVPPIISS